MVWIEDMNVAELRCPLRLTFYGRSPSLSYFVGCSDGGREALMEAQRYPEDFDGIIAGAPANQWSHHFTGFVWNEQALLKDAASSIPPAKLPVIQNAALVCGSGLRKYIQLPSRRMLREAAQRRILADRKKSWAEYRLATEAASGKPMRRQLR